MSDSPRLSIKISVLAMIAVGLLMWDWWLIESVLYSSSPLVFWIWPAGVAALAITALSFFALTNTHKPLFYGFNFLVLVGYLAIMPQDWYVWLGGLIFVLLLVWFENRIRAEERARHDFSIIRTVGLSVNIVIYAFLILLGFNIYHHTSQDFRIHPEQVYERIGQSLARGAQLAPQDLASSELTGLVVASLTAKVQETVEPYEQFFPLIFTLFVVALLRTFAFVFRWLVIVTAWLLFRLLSAVKFFKISKVTVEVDKLEI